MKLLEPGIYHNIPAADYHKLPYLGSSTIKRFKDNPATCRDEIEQTRPMILGEASHAYSLEGVEAFNRLFVVAPEFPCPPDHNPKGWKNTNRYKDLVANFNAMNIGKVVLDADEGATVLALDQELRRHPMAREFMERGADELTVIWDHVLPDGRTVRCKARIDWYREGIPSDWKTANRVHGIPWMIAERNYDIQGAHYSMGLIANGEDVKAFGFLFGETVKPNRVKTGYLHADSLDWAMTETSRLIGLFVECQERDRWPNFEIPEHIYSLDHLQPFDLLDEWSIPRGRR